ncbi:protocadherin gamma-A11-like [Carcharodon carcharias]|uniref:protocadherin gamma-A11-like n=1 Tax=Carcharodon carcharias TaxID=13397 RepID=UPI001B7EC1D0|nr:protocadherin gamma-A11-like [Carcharodon carcharias]
MGDVINYPFSMWHILCGILLYASDSICADIRYSIPEELEPGAFVGDIARDLGLDAAQLAAHKFRIISEQKLKYLDVNFKTGTLVINKKIDREQHCHQDLVCVMRLDAVTENPVKLYRVEIEITDINDNSPIFDRREFSFEISEMTSPGARFRLQNANDPDAGTNSVRTYELSRNEHFILDLQTNKEQTDTPILVLGRSLDREQQPIHQLTLKAIDGGTPRRTGTTRFAITVVDVNDNAPVFEQDVYQVTIPEDVPSGLLILQVKAVDMDEGLNGEVVYYFSDNTPSTIRRRFRVDAGSGEIKVIGSLDFEEAHDYAISVQAKDRGSVAVAAYCKVMVNVTDVNDNAPEITVASTFNPLREQAPPGTAVILIKVIDADSDEKGEVSCRVRQNSPFKLDSSFNNYYAVVTMSVIDRETNPEYNITVTCEDGGSPPLQTNKTIPVQVSDINDNAPRFTQPSFTMYVMENNAMGFSIGSVSAFDPDYSQNGKLSYNILDSLVHGLSIMSFVSINSASGAIYAEKSFDYEQIKTFQVHVEVKDAGFTPLGSNATVNVIITDQNDNAPVVLSPLPREGSAAEDTMPKTANSGYLLAKVTASDADSGQNAQISYHILQPTDESLFIVAPETGEIWTIRLLEQKDPLRQKIVILVKDGGTPSLSSTVTINVSVLHGDTENASSIGLLWTSGPWKSDLNFCLIISFGITSFILLLAIVILSIKVHRGGRKINSCCWNVTYFSRRGSLRGIQKVRVNLQVPLGYTDAYESDSFPQSFLYEVGPDSAMSDFIKLHGSSAPIIYIRTGTCVAAEHRNASKPANKETTTIQESVENDSKTFVFNELSDKEPMQVVDDRSHEQQEAKHAKICRRKRMLKCSWRSSTTPITPNTKQYRRNEQQSAPCLHRQNKAREDLYQETKRRVSTVVRKLQLFTWITQQTANKLALLNWYWSDPYREQRSTHRLPPTAVAGGIPPNSGPPILTLLCLVRKTKPQFAKKLLAKKIFYQTTTAVDMDEGPNGKVIYSFSGHTPIRVREVYSLNWVNGEIIVTVIVDFEEAMVQTNDGSTFPLLGYCEVLMKVTGVLITALK